MHCHCVLYTLSQELLWHHVKSLAELQWLTTNQIITGTLIVSNHDIISRDGPLAVQPWLSALLDTCSLTFSPAYLDKGNDVLMVQQL